MTGESDAGEEDAGVEDGGGSVVVQPDAGDASQSTVDSGTVDVIDAAPAVRSPEGGCNCGSTADAPLTGLLALLLARKRKRV